MSTVQPQPDPTMLEVRHLIETKDGRVPQSFRPESLTPALVKTAWTRIEQSGAFKSDGHFVHHVGVIGEEFHTKTWFGSDAAFCDSSILVSAIPAMVSKLGAVATLIEVVVGVVTGGAVMAGEMVRQLETIRSHDQESVGCLLLRHDSDSAHDYVFSNQSKDWLHQWRSRHRGRSPRCLLLDDVLFSGKTTLNCAGVMMSEGMNVTAILHLAEVSGVKLPKLIDIPRASAFEFDPGPIYKFGRCPLCVQHVKRTIV